MKAERKIFKGIEYVEASQLPSIQLEKLLQTINRDLFIKILVDDKVVSQCLQYKDYANWFDNVYSAKPAQPVVVEKVSAPIFSGKLALDKV